jgi:triosephosphate isomerase (TIM)
MSCSRRKLVAGNWKMYKTLAEGQELAMELRRLVSMVRQVDVAVIPPALLVAPIAHTLRESNIGVGVQNIHGPGFGAYTGELSSDMLAGTGATYCLAGHSERRKYFGETSTMVNEKVKAILTVDLVPILCIGETIEQRQASETFPVLKEQLLVGLTDLTDEQVAGLVVAYEPVWAIGTGHTASAEQVEEVHTFLRTVLTDEFGSATAEKVRIQYGGSVKPSNAAELLHTPNVDGALVGGASLDATSFADIVKAGKC